MILTRFIFFTIILFLINSSLYAQISRGTIQEGLIIKSKILNKDVRFTIYLPFDYNSSNRFYPITYLLHGYTDNDMGWMQFGEAHLIADEAIDKREIPPMILAMPDGGVSWYINNYDNSIRYEDFFFKEFIPYIELKYRVRTEKRYRGVAGLSMGGYGTLVYALKHPEMFTACAAFSAAVFTKKDITDMAEEKWEDMLAVLYGPALKGEKRITDHLLSNNPIHIVQNSNLEKIRSVRMYIDCGDDDFLYRGNSMFHILLKDMNVPHEYRVRDGRHQWSYWRSGLKDGLKFIGTSFHQP